MHSLPINLNKIDPQVICHGAFSIDNQPVYLAKTKRDVFPPINQLNEKSPFLFAGDPDQFLTQNNNNEELKRQLKNKVRKCGSCSKPNAFTLPTCNGCGQSLKEIPISFTNNVFSGFIYGMEKGPFPFTISIRKQTEALLIFDDLLSLTPCHFNAIPTKEYLPDFRFWLKDPKKGLQMLEMLFENSWQVVKEQFLNNLEWKKKWIRNYENLKDEEFQKHLIVGFNYPPSQYQLHIQFHLPPFLPFQYQLYLKGVHYTKGRFFPIEYAREILKVNDRYEVNDETPIEEIMKYYETKHGISYDKIHQECYERYGSSHRLLANYSLSDFSGVIFDSLNKFLPFNPDKSFASVLSEEDVKIIQAQDKEIIQNYGRPYSSDQKPTGSYYKYPKQFGQLNVW